MIARIVGETYHQMTHPLSLVCCGLYGLPEAIYERSDTVDGIFSLYCVQERAVSEVPAAHPQ